MNPGIAFTGLLVGLTVGMTGMGGGALMTPILVLVFGIEPLTAVSSDLVAAVVMKPVGGVVHLRRGTVHIELVRWLVLGSVPAAFAGVLILRQLGDGASVQERIKLLLGAALLLAAASIVGKAVLQGRRGQPVILGAPARPLRVKVAPTVLIGVLGGLVVGMTSVGSGSLMIVLLLMLYPSLTSRQLVGTDLVQAVPLVASAAFGHLLFGDFQLDLTGSLLLGSLPGVYIGARVSSRAPEAVIKPVLVTVLLASALKLLGMTTVALAWSLPPLALSAGAAMAFAARRPPSAGHGQPSDPPADGLVTQPPTYTAPLAPPLPQSLRGASQQDQPGT